jgi:transglutaminase-like putative cysteine protease
MRRAVSVGVVCVWLLLLGILVRSTWVPGSHTEVPLAPHAPGPGEQWMGVYHQDTKIGYTYSSLTPAGDQFVFSETSLLRLTVLETSQTVRTSMRGHLDRDFALHDVDFELSSGVGNLRATAAVDGKKLHLKLLTGKDVTEQVLPLDQPLYLPAPLRASLTAGVMQPGRVLQALVFDPTTLRNDRIRITVVGRERVPHAEPDVEAWRVTEEFRGVQTTSWIDASGAVLREEGPLGFVLVRQSPEQATAQDWTTQTALDVVASAAVPVAQPIVDARHRETLTVRLSGINLDDVPSDDEQVRDGALITMTRPALSAVHSYTLPYAAGGHADDLAPTAFLQSDHPRIRATARKVIGGESDALSAATRLNDWVYRSLRKVPTVSIPNALQVLDMGEGDCNEHAVLLAALARAVGIPTRVVAGAVYLDGAFQYHAWCELWLGQWVSIDPAFHQFPVDATHIKFVIGGPETHLAMLSVIGRLHIEVVDTHG